MANDQTTTITIPQQYQTVSAYDRIRASLDGIALFSKQATYTVTEARGSANITNKGQTFIIETARTEHGDYCFLQRWDEDGTVRIALPPVVVNAMMRQKEALAKRNRSRRAKAVMQERIAAGENPAAHLLAFRKRKLVKSQKQAEQ